MASGQTVFTDGMIAQREYTILDSDPRLSVTVTLGMPRKRESDGRFDCEVRIVEPERVTVRHISGEDAFEAIQLGLIILGTDLKHINEQLGGALSWNPAHPDQLGFPTYPDFSLMSKEKKEKEGKGGKEKEKEEKGTDAFSPVSPSAKP